MNYAPALVTCSIWNDSQLTTFGDLCLITSSSIGLHLSLACRLYPLSYQRKHGRFVQICDCGPFGAVFSIAGLRIPAHHSVEMLQSGQRFFAVYFILCVLVSSVDNQLLWVIASSVAAYARQCGASLRCFGRQRVILISRFQISRTVAVSGLAVFVFALQGHSG